MGKVKKIFSGEKMLRIKGLIPFVHCQRYVFWGIFLLGSLMSSVAGVFVFNDIQTVEEFQDVLSSHGAVVEKSPYDSP